MYDMQLLFVFALIVLTVALNISKDNVNETIESIENEVNIYNTTEDYDDYDVEKRKIKIIRKIALFLIISVYVVFFIRCCLIAYRIIINLWQTRHETFNKSSLKQNNQSRIEHQVDDSNKHIEERGRTNKRKEECKYDKKNKRIKTYENRNKNRDGTDILNNLSMDDDSDKYSIFEPRPKRMFSDTNI